MTRKKLETPATYMYRYIIYSRIDYLISVWGPKMDNSDFSLPHFIGDLILRSPLPTHLLLIHV